MYGLIGKKLGHSFSADFFNAKFKKEGIENEYRLFPIASIDEFPKLLEENPDIQGLNVTIPYKQQILPYLTSLSPEAKEIGAVNVIKFVRNREGLVLIGYNSDSIGFTDSLVPLLTSEMGNALVLGTGGASKAVVYALQKLGIKVALVSRTPGAGILGYNDLSEEIVKNNQIIVNTTPLGMYPDIENIPPFPYRFLDSRHLCYDLIYNPADTSFMKEAAKHGAKVKNGLEMLHLQAIAAWNIWNS